VVDLKISFSLPQVWDLERSTLDPFIRFTFPAVTKKQLSRVLFARNGHAVLTVRFCLISLLC
jgi:hypothetical protein